MTRIKICCISSLEEALLALRSGATALGLVSEMPTGPGVIDEGAIAQIVAQLPPSADTFLLTSATDAPSIIAQWRRCRPSTLQLVDAVPFGDLKTLREALDGVKIVQVIHVVGPESIEEAVNVAPWVDAILLDSGNPALRELGGTGRAHDWSISARLRQAVDPVPVYLAGGLKASNAAAAMVQVKPYGLDICSGVRTDGKLDADKLTAFIGAVRRQDADPEVDPGAPSSA